MKSDSLSGFWVVLSKSEDTVPLNLNYVGADRVPSYPSDFPEEAQAIDDYVFGDFKDLASNLIPSYEKAVALLDAFAKSPREFEIIACCYGPDDPILDSLPRGVQQSNLGYDVAGISGDGWSIVHDISASEWAKPYLAALNEYGLFRTRSEAERYLEDYQRHREADWNSGFNIVFVVRLQS